MKRALVLQHIEREGPGLVGELLARRGLEIQTLALDRGVPVPSELTRDEVLVVMGGFMGVGDLGDPRYPFLAPEIALLREVLARRQPVLGVCLGAQLLAFAAGSRVYPNQGRDERGLSRPLREVGFGEVRLLGREQEAALAGLEASIPVLHWHGDTFDLPAGAVHLAATDACANQAFRIGTHAFGLQFHVEIDAETACTWAREDRDFVVSALGPGGPAEIIAASETTTRAVRRSGERLLDNIIALIVDGNPERVPIPSRALAPAGKARLRQRDG